MADRGAGASSGRGLDGVEELSRAARAGRGSGSKAAKLLTLDDGSLRGLAKGRWEGLGDGGAGAVGELLGEIGTDST